MSGFAQRRGAWQRYLPLLDAALCAHWDTLARITRTSSVADLRDFLLDNDLGASLYWLVQRAGRSRVLPAQLLLELMGSAGHARVCNQQLLEILGELATAADRAGIRLVCLKGLHLTSLLYDGCIDARRMRDLDILVAPEQCAALEQVLLTANFSPGPRLPLGLERRLAHARHWRRGDVEIDAHHALRVQPGYRLDTPGFIARCQEQTIYSLPVYAPLEADTLVLLLLSLCNDLERGTVRARALVDLWLLLARCEASLDWEDYFAFLGRLRLRQPALAALRIVAAGLPDAMAELPGLQAALVHGETVREDAALDLLAGRPLRGRLWYLRHGPLPAPCYLAWLLGGMPLRRWLNS